jgi:transposase
MWYTAIDDWSHDKTPMRSKMAAIPVSVTDEQFTTHIKPYLSTAKRGYQSKQPLVQIFNLVLHVLHTGCQWEETPVPQDSAGHPLMSWQVPRYHFYKWSKDGSFERLFHAGILKIRYELNLSILNLDGSHSAAKKGAKQSPIRVERRPKPVISSH